MPVKLGPYFLRHTKTQSNIPKNSHLGAHLWYFSPCPNTITSLVPFQSSSSVNQGHKVCSHGLVCGMKSQCSKVWAKFSYQPKRKDYGQSVWLLFRGKQTSSKLIVSTISIYLVFSDWSRTRNCLPCEPFVYTFLIPGSFKYKKIPLFELALNNTPETFNGLWRRARAQWLTVPSLLAGSSSASASLPVLLGFYPFWSHRNCAVRLPGRGEGYYCPTFHGTCGIRVWFFLWQRVV